MRRIALLCLSAVLFAATAAAQIPAPPDSARQDTTKVRQLRSNGGLQRPEGPTPGPARVDVHRIDLRAATPDPDR